jgi:glucokinase
MATPVFPCTCSRSKSAARNCNSPSGDETGRILDRRRFVVDRAAGGAGIRAQIASALPELLAQWKPRAIGVGYGGPVDWRTGRIVKSHHIEGWNDFPLAEWLPVAQRLADRRRERCQRPPRSAKRCTVRGRVQSVFWVNYRQRHRRRARRRWPALSRRHTGRSRRSVTFRLDRDGTIVEDRCSGWSSRPAPLRGESSASRTPRSRCSSRHQRPGCEARHLGAALAQATQLAQRILDDALAGWPSLLARRATLPSGSYRRRRRASTHPRRTGARW